MKGIKETAYAKLNISLDVTGKREDGFHDMVMIMQSVSLCDELSILPTEGGRVEASSNLRFVPRDERNLAVRAAQRFLEAAGVSGQGFRIDLKKGIPVGAGMAGGSSDAAAVLRGLNRMYGRPFDRAGLEELSARIGSDVAFCVSGGTMLAQGRGEQLSPLPSMPDCVFTICKPDFSISTPELFRKLDSAPLKRHPDTPGLLRALEEGDLAALCRRMYNVFEDVDDRRMRTVAEIRSAMLDHGALGAMMTGTGSAVFGVFRSEEAAQAACAALRQDWRFCRIARPVERIEI